MKKFNVRCGRSYVDDGDDYSYDYYNNNDCSTISLVAIAMMNYAIINIYLFYKMTTKINL